MKKPRLGFISTGGLITAGASIILVFLAWFIFGNLIFSPGKLSEQSTGQIIGEVQSHAQLSRDCKSCHPTPWSDVDQNDLCLDCHLEISVQLNDRQSLHGAVWASGLLVQCRDCHTEHAGRDGNLTIYGGENFPHDLVGFSLRSHSDIDWNKEIACEDCHSDDLQTMDISACQDCHQVIDNAFYEAHMQDYGKQCLACHDGLETVSVQYSHDQGGFPLTGAHLEVLCSSCHTGSRSRTDLESTPTECLACHGDQDPHRGELGTICDDCHTTDGWIPAIFDHGQTGFPLSFGHANQLCSSCHGDQTFQGTSPVCYSCHEEDDPHQHLFGDGCDTCHNTIKWTYVSFDHTGPFSEYCSACHLDDQPGNHYPGECSACHQTTAWLPATFDHAVAGAVDCQGCHLSDKPANHFPGQCSICHNTAGWLPAYFNHTFPLNHGGAGSTCTRCHTSNNYYTYTCYSCHEHNKNEIKNEHEGISNLENCVRCHWDGRKHDDGGGDDD